ncbi:hypothetical protein [Telluribacter sp.]|uniref:hypothetical protein n=1 Tax=Telluribacter sp. TaxID=1978767 RepID=UPI002E10E8AE|nr:hypothetical protein [Telluribacter sp.]
MPGTAPRSGRGDNSHDGKRQNDYYNSEAPRAAVAAPGNNANISKIQIVRPFQP